MRTTQRYLRQKQKHEAKDRGRQERDREREREIEREGEKREREEEGRKWGLLIDQAQIKNQELYKLLTKPVL